MKKNYVPQPMDTTAVQLPKELDELVEQMSKNVHEVWAQSRMSHVGPMASNATTPSKPTLVLFLTRIFPRSRRPTIVILRSVL